MKMSTPALSGPNWAVCTGATACWMVSTEGGIVQVIHATDSQADPPQFVVSVLCNPTVLTQEIDAVFERCVERGPAKKILVRCLIRLRAEQTSPPTGNRWHSAADEVAA